MAVKVDGQYRLDLEPVIIVFDRVLDRAGADRERRRIDIDEQRRGAGHLDGGDGGDSRMGYRNHQVARRYAGRAQRQMQGVGSVCDSHAALRAEVIGEFTLELARLFAEDVPAAVQRLSNGLVNLAFVSQVTRLWIGLQNGAGHKYLDKCSR